MRPLFLRYAGIDLVRTRSSSGYVITHRTGPSRSIVVTWRSPGRWRRRNSRSTSAPAACAWRSWRRWGSAGAETTNACGSPPIFPAGIARPISSTSRFRSRCQGFELRGRCGRRSDQARRVIGGRGWSREDEAVINAAAAYPGLVPVLRSGSMTLVPPPRGAERAALSTVARDAIDLFATVDPARLRECESDECGLLFLDTSRPGKRRWCSSEACGGKVRAASYRQRGRVSARAST